ncbi:ABC transporter ATP-binding protein [Jatrophihabitans sp. DSM 45814]
MTDRDPDPNVVHADLDLSGVEAGYGRSVVLSDFNLRISASEVIAVLGPNGAGKSTALKVAAGLLPTNGGKVNIGGKDATRFSAERRVRAGVCLIPEGRGIFRSLSVRENLELQVPSWRKDLSIEPALVAFPKLGQRLRQQAGSMSGGEQQMLALSRAFVSDPRVVLLDEVSLGLAPVIVDQIFEALAALAGTGVALIIVEQYVQRALAIATRACVISSGQIRWQGAASSLDQDVLHATYFGDGVATVL